MPPWSRRLLFPCSLLLVVAVMIWQYKAPDASAVPTESTYRNDEIDIRIQTDETPILPMEETTFHIHVQDASGNPVNDANVQLSITMPSMYCGEFYAKITFKGEGAYEARVAPVMNGKWEAKTIIQDGEQQYTVKHPFAAHT